MPQSNTGYLGAVSREEVFNAINGEREYQDLSWCAATTPTEGKHSITEFLVYMQHYMDIARKEASTQADPEATKRVLDELRKVVTLGVAGMEQNGVIFRDKYQIEALRRRTELDDEIPF